MNRFLCSFAAIVAVVNGYSIGGGNKVSSGGGAVIGGRAYQLLPAVSVSTVDASIPSSGGSGSPCGYGSNYCGSSGGYGTGSSIDIAKLLAAIGDDLTPAQAAQLVFSLPSAGGPLIDITGLTPGGSSGVHGVAGGNLAYVVAPAPAPVPGKYPAPAPAPAPVPAPVPAYVPSAAVKYGSAVAAGSYIGTNSAAVPY